MEDLTLKQIKRMKRELEDDMLQLIRNFEFNTNMGIERIELNTVYQFGTSHSMVVSVETKLNI